MASQNDSPEGQNDTPNPALECFCCEDPERDTHCIHCDDTGQFAEWQCSDCENWWRADEQPPDPECWTEWRERLCGECAPGRKLDTATAILRQIVQRFVPCSTLPPEQRERNPYQRFIDDANVVFRLAGEEPV